MTKRGGGRGGGGGLWLLQGGGENNGSKKKCCPALCYQHCMHKSRRERELFPKKVSSRERRVSALLPFLNNKWEVRGRKKVTVAAYMGLQRAFQSRNYKKNKDSLSQN